MFGVVLGQRWWSSCKWKSEFESCHWRFGIQEAPLTELSSKWDEEGPRERGVRPWDGKWMDILVGSKVLDSLNSCCKNWLCYTAIYVFVMVH